MSLGGWVCEKKSAFLRTKSHAEKIISFGQKHSLIPEQKFPDSFKQTKVNPLSTYLNVNLRVSQKQPELSATFSSTDQDSGWVLASRPFLKNCAGVLVEALAALAFGSGCDTLNPSNSTNSSVRTPLRCNPHYLSLISH
jgi:hypothetical protein